MKALIDTNVLLDMISKREPFCWDARKIFELVRKKKIKGYVSVQSLKDIYFISKKFKITPKPRAIIENLSYLFEIIDVRGEDSFSTMMSDIDDYEDGLLLFSARRNKIEAIITRNERDFFEGDIIVINPKEIDKYLDTFVEEESIIIDNVFDHRH